MLLGAGENAPTTVALVVLVALGARRRAWNVTNCTSSGFAYPTSCRSTGKPAIEDAAPIVPLLFAGAVSVNVWDSGEQGASRAVPAGATRREVRGRLG